MSHLGYLLVVIGEPYIYHDSGVDYKEVGRLWWEFVRVINIYTSLDYGLG